MNYFEHVLVFLSTVSGCVSISAFNSLFGGPEGTLNFAVVQKVSPITAVIKKYKSIIKKKRQKYDKIVLLGKAKLDSTELLISKALTESYINHDEFLSINIVLRECNEMNKEIRNPQNAVKYTT